MKIINKLINRRILLIFECTTVRPPGVAPGSSVRSSDLASPAQSSFCKLGEFNEVRLGAILAVVLVEEEETLLLAVKLLPTGAVVGHVGDAAGGLVDNGGLGVVEKGQDEGDAGVQLDRRAVRV